MLSTLSLPILCLPYFLRPPITFPLTPWLFRGRKGVDSRRPEPKGDEAGGELHEVKGLGFRVPRYLNEALSHRQDRLALLNIQQYIHTYIFQSMYICTHV